MSLNGVLLQVSTLRFCILIIQLAFLYLVGQSPCFAQFTRSFTPETLSLFTSISTGTTLAFFMLFVVYAGSAFALLVASKYKVMGVINLIVSGFSFALMTVEPAVIDILAASGFQYTVKITTQLALVSICAMAACALMLLPSILAISKNTSMKPLIVILNICGLIIFPLFILALYLVQNQIGERRWAERKEGEKSDDELDSKLEGEVESKEHFWADSKEFSEEPDPSGGTEPDQKDDVPEKESAEESK